MEPKLARTRLCLSQTKKAHKHKFFGPVGLGTTPGLSQEQTRSVPGTSPVCPWDKARFSPYFTQWKPSLSQGKCSLSLGQTRGRRAAEKIDVLKVYVLAIEGRRRSNLHLYGSTPCKLTVVPHEAGKVAHCVSPPDYCRCPCVAREMAHHRA